MRNSSVPAPTTAPTVAVRAEITPLSGATTWVYLRRNCCAFSVALAASTRACAVFSAVVYCWICCWLKAPVACSERARSALAAASAALAWASSRLARTWATSACTVSAEKVASTWPALTTSPTFTRTSVRRRPLLSAPMLASCQAATLPLAARRRGTEVRWGWAVLTVSAGRGWPALGSSAARGGPEENNAPPPARPPGGETGGRWGWAVLTVSAGRGWPALGSSAARDAPEKTSAPPVASTQAVITAKAGGENLKKIEEGCMCICPGEFISAVHGVGRGPLRSKLAMRRRGQPSKGRPAARAASPCPRCAAMRERGGGAKRLRGGSHSFHPPPAARYSATQAAWRSCCSAISAFSAARDVRRASSSSTRLARPPRQRASVASKDVR